VNDQPDGGEPGSFVDRRVLSDRVERFSRMLVASDPRSPEPIASSLAAMLDGRPMLVTAAHTLRSLGDRQLLAARDSTFTEVSTDSVVVDDDHDIAVLPLPMSAKRWGIDFLYLDRQFEPELTSEKEWFLGVGFPWREAQHHRPSSTVRYRVVNYWGFEATEAYAPTKLSRTDWLLTRFRRTRSVREGRIEAMKKPHGMSGGPMWRFWAPPDQPPSLRDASLAGIMVEYSEGTWQYIQSARLEHVQQLAARSLETSPSN